MGDTDRDGVVDKTDFGFWSMCMLGPSSGPYVAGCEVFDFDFDCDGQVDVEDFAGFQRVFRE